TAHYAAGSAARVAAVAPTQLASVETSKSKPSRAYVVAAGPRAGRQIGPAFAARPPEPQLDNDDPQLLELGAMDRPIRLQRPDIVRQRAIGDRFTSALASSSRPMQRFARRPSRDAALARRLPSPRKLRQAPVDAFRKVAQLRWHDRHRLALRPRPDEAAAIQALGEQAHALAVVPQDLDQPVALAAEPTRWPQWGLRFSVSCPKSANPSKPRRMSRRVARQPRSSLRRRADHRSTARNPAQHRLVDVAAELDPDTATKPDLDGPA